MSKLRFFTDEHIDKAIVTQLRRRDIDVIRCEDVGMKVATDSELLEYATQQGYALLSMDDDVTRLHGQWMKAEKPHGGISTHQWRTFKGKPE